MKFTSNVAQKEFKAVGEFDGAGTIHTMFVRASIDKEPGDFFYWNIVGYLHYGSGSSMMPKPYRWGRIDGLMVAAFPDMKDLVSIRNQPFDQKNEKHVEIAKKYAIPLRRMTEVKDGN